MGQKEDSKFKQNFLDGVLFDHTQYKVSFTLLSRRKVL
jgi:hypothetical protein